MRCSRAEELISLSFDGDLGFEDSRKLEEHIRSCARCELHRDRLHHISALFRSAPMLAPTNNMVPAVMLRIEGLDAMAAHRRSSPAAFAAASVAVLFVLIAANVVLGVAAYGATQSGLSADSLGILVSLAWKLLAITSLLGDIVCDVIFHLGATAQEIVLPLVLCTGLALVALWAHILRNYRGLEVRH